MRIGSFILLLSLFAVPAGGIPIQDLPNLLTIFVCHPIGVGSTECGGFTQAQMAQLAAHPDTALTITFPAHDGTVRGGLSDRNGDLGAGDEFFYLRIIGSGNTFFLDSVALIFPGGTPAWEHPSAIVFTNVSAYHPTSGPEDLPNAMGPHDGATVGILDGTLVFAFASVPEPTTALLVGFGIALLTAARMRTT